MLKQHVLSKRNKKNLALFSHQQQINSSLMLLQITRLAHFDYVHAEDLERIGISKPGVRRLLDTVRKKKLQLWNRKFWNKLFGSSVVKEKAEITRPPVQTESRTTCIILEKDIVLVCYCELISIMMFLFSKSVVLSNKV